MKTNMYNQCPMPVEAPSPGKIPPPLIGKLLENAGSDSPSDAAERAERNRSRRLWKMRTWAWTKVAIVLGIFAGAVFGGKRAIKRGCDCSVVPISTPDH